ncbi:MAG TPA: cyclic nucleotide-binding domain-containing protein [Candidatus Krumholzibacteria bacterium]|nr:cyclic nucleotide-binding domain-containing protein [Candidatus Krumholzibacteria bacterium]
MSDPRFVGPIDRLLYLRTLPQLQGIATRDLTALSRQAEEVVLRRGDLVLREGEPVDRFFVIVSGQVAVFSHGREIVSCGSGENVGIIPALSRVEPNFEARAATEGVALVFELDAIVAALEENFRLLQNLLRNVASYHLQIMPRIVAGSSRVPWTGEAVSLPKRSLDAVERLVLLRRGNIFRNLGLEALMLMATSMRQERWTGGTELWRPGETADHLLVILEGEVECRLPDGGTFEAGRGYPLGNLETLARGERWYTPVARTDVTTLRGNHEALFDVLEDDFDVAMDFLAAVAAGAMKAVETLAERSVQGAPASMTISSP